MRFVVGIIVLFVALVASLMLVLDHFGGMSLPGCGPGSACAAAAASAWGKVPGLAWPTSFVGLSYFAAMLIAWLWTGGFLRPLLAGVAVVGGLASLTLIVAMIAGGYLCQYCIAVHAGNLVFVALVLATTFGSRGAPRKADTSPIPPRNGFAPFAAAVILVSGALLVTESIVSAQVEEKAEQDLEQTSRDLANNTTAREAFTGRYLTGPENAPIRLVVFSDFQCTDCQRIEGEIRQLLAERDDLSVSAKHFPMCTMCNPYMGDRNLHPNACWAARAAETAGILRGDDGFWQMYHWLFDRGGSFTDAELNVGLQELGYDQRQFLTIMQGEETLKRVKADIDEAVGLGIFYTPMIFINGVELKGWTAPNAVRRMVEQVAATNPQPAPPTADQPPSANEKFVADWREQPVRQLKPAIMSWPMGSPDAPLRVVVWGDLQELSCATADAQVRAYIEKYPGMVQYEFRQYPFDPSCNRFATRTFSQWSCVASKAALAAGQLGGADAYWAMHNWLMQNQASLDLQSLQRAAGEAGVDSAALLSMMESQEIADAIYADAQAAKTVGLRSIPTVFINDRFLPRWHRDNDPTMLERVLNAARGAE